MQSLCRYVAKIKGNSRRKQFKIVVTGETSSWQTIPQSSGTREEATRLELTSQQWNTEEMLVAWRALVVNVRFSQTKEHASSEHIPWKYRWRSQRLATCRL